MPARRLVAHAALAHGGMPAWRHVAHATWARGGRHVPPQLVRQMPCVLKQRYDLVHERYLKMKIRSVS
jgi:hypothetical protein